MTIGLGVAFTTGFGAALTTGFGAGFGLGFGEALATGLGAGVGFGVVFATGAGVGVGFFFLLLLLWLAIRPVAAAIGTIAGAHIISTLGYEWWIRVFLMIEFQVFLLLLFSVLFSSYQFLLL